MSLRQTDLSEAVPAPPNVMIIFGAGGDLTRRKLVPALYHLCSARLLPDGFVMLGLDRVDLDEDGFRAMVAEKIRDHVGDAYDETVWERLVQRMHYMRMDMLSGPDYELLCERLSRIDAERATEGNYLFYTDLI